MNILNTCHYKLNGDLSCNFVWLECVSFVDIETLDSVHYCIFQNLLSSHADRL